MKDFNRIKRGRGNKKKCTNKISGILYKITQIPGPKEENYC